MINKIIVFLVVFSIFLIFTFLGPTNLMGHLIGPTGASMSASATSGDNSLKLDFEGNESFIERMAERYISPFMSPLIIIAWLVVIYLFLKILSIIRKEYGEIKIGKRIKYLKVKVLK